MNNRYSRVAISALFFFHGLCFSSWGVRIPAIQEGHALSEAALGSLLLSIPMGSILSMPLAATLVSRLGSRFILTLAIALYSLGLVSLGLAPTVVSLTLCLISFGLFSNLVNVSLNTQAVLLETHYPRPIMASLHGLWSLAGFVGGAIGSVMIGAQIVPYQHFILITLIVMIGTAFSFKNLLPDEKKKAINENKFRWPDRSLLGLGLIAFCTMICEGAMFDWSGVYFKKVVEAKGAWIGAGYVAFMTTMAGTRFVADHFKAKFGFKKVLQMSGLLIFVGLLLSTIFPYLVPALIGFLLVGSGVSAVVPMVFSEAGKTQIMSPSAAIAAVSTIGFMGFLLGPPLIGWIAGMLSLRLSFMLVAFIGISISFLGNISKTSS